MDDVRDVRIEPCSESRYIRPYRLHYVQNGVKKFWDLIQSHDSVAVLIYNTSRKAFILVKQFRPALYLRKCMQKSVECDSLQSIGEVQFDLSGSAGISYELCAGIVDRDHAPAEIAKAEVLEECGYDVPLANISLISAHHGNVGTSGNRGHLFYAEVDDAMKKTDGGGLVEEGEIIDVVEVPLDEARAFMFDSTKPTTVGLMFAFMWFFDKRETT